MLQVERAHRFCIKYIQELPTFTRTDICLSLIGSRPTEFETDKRKLSFLGQLCNLNSTHISKTISCYRLVSYYTAKRVQTGFIPEIIRLLQTYNLEKVLLQYLDTGQFPSKFAWKKMVDKVLNEFSQTQWKNRVESQNQTCDYNTNKAVIRTSM